MKNDKTQYLAKLRNKVTQMSSPKGSASNNNNDNDKFWKVEQDKSGLGSAVIRFLPPKSGDEFPFVQLFTHGFQGPTQKWFIANCPTSIGGDNCPACKANTLLWATGEESNKTLARNRKRKLNYISNILVVNDPKHPENNGKVFLFKYGKKIFEKINGLLCPEFDDIKPCDPFDPEEGANFKLRMTRSDGYPSYEKSTFDPPTALGDDDEISSILSQLHSLSEIVDQKNFKSTEELQKYFDYVTGESAAQKPQINDSESDPWENEPVVTQAKAKVATAKSAGKTASRPTKEEVIMDTDDFISQLTKE